LVEKPAKIFGKQKILPTHLQTFTLGN